MQDKQKAFVLYYLQDFNGTQAAIKAGYSQKTARSIACTLLGNAEIQKAIKDKLAEVEITTFRVLGELTKIAYADMGQFGTVEEGGRFEAFGFKDLEPGATRAIKKIKEKRKIIAAKDESDDTIIDNEYSFELHDKLKALELLGKHLGIWKEDQRAPQTISVDVDPILDALKISATTDWTEKDAKEATQVEAE